MKVARNRDVWQCHGHKSRSHLFTGFWVAVALEPTSDMLLDIADVTARGSDGEHLLPTIRRVEAQQAVTVERVIGDNAYGSGERTWPPAPTIPATPSSW